MKLNNALLITLLWCSCSMVTAQVSPVETSAGDDVQEQYMEETTVISQRSLHSLKHEAIRAEQLKFKIFNTLNSTDEFDIKCEFVNNRGMRIKVPVCEANYIREARMEDIRRARDHGIWWLPLRTSQQLAIEFSDKTKALNREMINLAARHPELATAMIRAYELNQRYDAQRQEKFKHGMFIGHRKTENEVAVLNEIDAWHFAYQDHKHGIMTDVKYGRDGTVGSAHYYIKNHINPYRQ